MAKIMDMISSRLRERELVSLEINRFIKDVSNIIDRERSFESAGFRQALKSLGWEERLLDYRTMELIDLFLENEKVFDRTTPP